MFGWFSSFIRSSFNFKWTDIETVLKAIQNGISKASIFEPIDYTFFAEVLLSCAPDIPFRLYGPFEWEVSPLHFEPNASCNIKTQKNIQKKLKKLTEAYKKNTIRHLRVIYLQMGTWIFFGGKRRQKVVDHF